VGQGQEQDREARAVQQSRQQREADSASLERSTTALDDRQRLESVEVGANSRAAGGEQLAAERRVGEQLAAGDGGG